MKDENGLIGRIPVSIELRDRLREFKTSLGATSYEQTIELLLFMATDSGKRTPFESGKLYKRKLEELRGKNK